MDMRQAGRTRGILARGLQPVKRTRIIKITRQNGTGNPILKALHIPEIKEDGTLPHTSPGNRGTKRWRR